MNIKCRVFFLIRSVRSNVRGKSIPIYTRTTDSRDSFPPQPLLYCPRSRPRGQSLISVRNPYYFGSSLRPIRSFADPSARPHHWPPYSATSSHTAIRGLERFGLDHLSISRKSIGGSEAGGSRVNINLSPFKPIRIHISGQTFLFIRYMLYLMCAYVFFLSYNAGVVFAFVPDHKFAEIDENTRVISSSSGDFLKTPEINFNSSLFN